MYEALYQYLLLHRQLDIPGVGCFQLERKPADIDFANKVIQPPLFTMALNASAEADPPVRLFRWLSDKLDITESDAIDRFNSFAGDLRREILSGKKLQWAGVGVLSKGLAGEIKFEPSLKDSPAGPAVPAVKVLREKALHSVRVGEDEKTSSEMLEYLNPAPARKSYEWILTVLVAILAVIFVAWHFMQAETESPTGSQQKVNAVPEAPTYRTP